MAIEAPLSKHKRNTFLIWMVVLIGFGVYCIYDGYFNEAFIEKNTDADGKADSTLLFNQKSPPFFIAAAVILGVWLLAIKNKKLTADDTELVIDGKKKIPYESIQKIDKTLFESKGHFTLTYRGQNGKEVDITLSDRTYDNLGAVLEHLVAKIS